MHSYRVQAAQGMRVGRFFEFESVESWATSAATALFERIRHTLDEKQDVWVALSGGTTPTPVYADLAVQILTLPAERQARIHILLVDERAVEFSDPRSNSLLIYNALHETGVSLHLISNAENAENASFHYSLYLNNRSIDVLVLGMGEDGHTASLFPGMRSMEDITYAYIVTDSPVDPHKRISLTFPVANASRHRFVLIRGERKKVMVNQLETQPMAEWPIERLISDSGTTLQWYWTP